MLLPLPATMRYSPRNCTPLLPWLRATSCDLDQAVRLTRPLDSARQLGISVCSVTPKALSYSPHLIRHFRCTYRHSSIPLQRLNTQRQRLQRCASQTSSSPSPWLRLSTATPCPPTISLEIQPTTPSRRLPRMASTIHADISCVVATRTARGTTKSASTIARREDCIGGRRATSFVLVLW